MATNGATRIDRRRKRISNFLMCSAEGIYLLLYIDSANIEQVT